MKSRNRHITPPRLAKKLLLWFIKDELAEEIQGDLEEKFYSTLDKHSARKAKRNYWYQVINYLRSFVFKFFKRNPLSHLMGVHNVTSGLRHLARNKAYSFINIFGLAIGMAVCLVIYQYIDYEQSYDRFHSKSDRIYRLKQDDLKNGNSTGTILQTHALGPTAQQLIPELQQVTRIRSHYDGVLIVTNPEKQSPLKEKGILSVDNSFLQLFDFPLVLGDKATALDSKNKVVIGKELAQRHFGSQNPIGKVLSVRGGAANGDFIVSGVLEEIPALSHLQFTMLFPVALEIDRYNYMKLDGWTARDFATYIQIDHEASPGLIAEKLNKIINEHSDTDLQSSVDLQPLTDIHLGRSYSGDIATGNGRQRDVYLYSLIAAFILLVAWANYVNLATAVALKRSREVGIRKSLGAHRKQLIGQFLTESFLINTISVILAIGIAYLGLPILNKLVDKQITFELLTQAPFWLYTLIILLVGSIVSGFYPAVILSGSTPVNLLVKGKHPVQKGFNLRSTLIAFQFTITLLLISGTYLIFKQISFMKQQDLGVDMEKILIIESYRTGQKWAYHRTAQETFKTEVEKHASIISATGSGRVPGRGFNTRARVRSIDTPKGQEHFGDMIFVDSDFVLTYGFEYLAYDTITARDYEHAKVTVINQKAVHDFGFQSAQEALNKQLIANRDTFIVKGVLKDFHWGSLKEDYAPYMFLVRPGGRTYFSIKMDLSNIPETLEYIESTFQAVFPENPFNAFFLDNDFNRHYQNDLQFGKLFAFFSNLAILIACIGLYALVSYSTTLRKKEIGIRKVLGAGAGHLLKLLTKEYAYLVLVALLFAVPMLVYLGRRWLENYSFHIEMSLDLLLIPTAILTAIAMLTISHRIYSSVRSNPVDSLRSE